MRIRYLRLLALVPALLLGFVAPVHASDAADRLALDAAQRAWVVAFNARDVQAMTALATAEIVLLPPGSAAVRGREAVLAHLHDATSGTKALMEVTREETVMLGEFAWSMGSYTQSVPNGAALGHGKFLEIWRREDGQWKLHRDMYSSSTPKGRRTLEPVPRPSEPVLDSPDLK